jgi:hypothetical protein
MGKRAMLIRLDLETDDRIVSLVLGNPFISLGFIHRYWKVWDFGRFEMGLERFLLWRFGEILIFDLWDFFIVMFGFRGFFLGLVGFFGDD